jgi:hypothetical protein
MVGPQLPANVVYVGRRRWPCNARKFGVQRALDPGKQIKGLCVIGIVVANQGTKIQIQYRCGKEEGISVQTEQV